MHAISSFIGKNSGLGHQGPVDWHVVTPIGLLGEKITLISHYRWIFLGAKVYVISKSLYNDHDDHWVGYDTVAWGKLASALAGEDGALEINIWNLLQE